MDHRWARQTPYGGIHAEREVGHADLATGACDEGSAERVVAIVPLPQRETNLTSGTTIAETALQR
ncbi:MAG: hypothetical protein ACREOK_07945, partial [Gemmatimonadaceae bacterium]